MQIDIHDQKAKIAEKIKKLEAREKLLNFKERKVLTKKMVDIGKIAIRAGLQDMDDIAMLGAFLEIREKLNEKTIVQAWQKAGALFVEAKKAAEGESFAVIFEQDLPQEMKSKFKELGFKWNPYRKEWYGKIHRNNLESLVVNFKAKIEPLR